MSTDERRTEALERIAAALEALALAQQPPRSSLKAIEDHGTFIIAGWRGEPELAELIGKRFYSKAAAEQAIMEATHGQC